LFGTKEDGVDLAQAYTYVNVVVGLVGGPVFGACASIIGLPGLGALVIFAELVSIATVTVPSWTAQYLACFGASLFGNVWQLFATRYLVLFPPPNRFGIVTGVFMLLIQIFLLPFLVVFNVWMEAIPDGVERYTIPTSWTLNVSLFLWFVYTLDLLIYDRLPKTCILLPPDERELCKGWGVRNFREAEEVLQLPKKELLRLAASDNALDQRRLIDRMTSSKAMKRWALVAEREAAKPQLLPQIEEQYDGLTYRSQKSVDSALLTPWLAEALDDDDQLAWLAGPRWGAPRA
jgi:hypothetical protein